MVEVVESGVERDLARMRSALEWIEDRAVRQGEDAVSVLADVLEVLRWGEGRLETGALTLLLAVMQDL